MFERFTQPAREAVVAAQVAARRLHHGWVGTEHLLLGLLAADDGIAARVLAARGVTAEAVEAKVGELIGGGVPDDSEALAAIGIDLDEVRRRVEASFGPRALERSGRRGGAGGHLPFCARTKKVLELSLREALRLHHNHIGAEHVLLGLVREGQGLAAQVLVALGADLEGIRAGVLSELRRAG